MRCRRSGDTEEQSFTHSSNNRSESLQPHGSWVSQEDQDVEKQATSLGAETSGKPAVYSYCILKLPPYL